MEKFTSKGKHKITIRNHHTNMISKPAIKRKGEYKRRILEIDLKLRDEKHKTILYININCFIKTS